MTSTPSIPAQTETVRDTITAGERVRLTLKLSPLTDWNQDCLRAVLMTLQQHERLEAEYAHLSETAGEDYERGVQSGMKLSSDHIERLEAMARRANESLKLLIRELTDPGTEALAAQWELERALAALGTAAPETPTDTELALSRNDVAENSGGSP